MALGFGALAPTSPARADACVVRGADVSVADVQVTPDGAAPFSVNVAHTAVAATPGRTPGDHAIEVDGALVFAGTATALPYAMARPATTAAGMVHLSTAAELGSVRSRPGGVAATVTLAGHVHLRRVHLRCDALTLDAPPAPPSDAEQPEGDGSLWVPRGRRLTLRRFAGRGAVMRVRTDIPVLMTLVRRRRSGEHFEVVWTGADGSRLEGWVHRSEVTPMPLGSYGGTTGGSGTIGCRPGTVFAVGLYRGPARVAAGAPVFATRGGAQWATVGEAGEVEVLHFTGEQFVQLRRVTGLEEPAMCGELGHAWVPLATVSLPTDADTRRLR